MWLFNINYIACSVAVINHTVCQLLLDIKGLYANALCRVLPCGRGSVWAWLHVGKCEIVVYKYLWQEEGE